MIDAVTGQLRPLDGVRVDELPCTVLADVLVDLAAGGNGLLEGWFGVTKTGERCDLPYGQIPADGAYWYARLGVGPGLRGASSWPEADRMVAVAVVTRLAKPCR